MKMYNKIFLELQGGLGNQLFQWTFAHHILKEVPSSDIKFCISNLPRKRDDNKSNPHDKLLTTCSHISSAPKLINSIIAKHQFPNKMWSVKLFRRMLEGNFGYYREDPRLNVEQSQIPTLSQVRILSGYFQSSRYVSSVSPWILQELMPILNSAIAIAGPKLSLPKIYSAIHVRSGDYFNSDVNNPLVIGRLSTFYYQQNLTKELKRPLVLLAPELNNIKNIVDILRPDIILTEEETTDWETLAIMAHAQHFFGANSSLSWWGAWLGLQRGNQVFLPESWSKHNIVNDSEYNFSGLIRVPANWE